MTENTNTVPEINKTAFSCPHCNAFTTQHWSHLYSNSYPNDSRTPNIPNPSLKEKFHSDPEINQKVKEELIEWIDKMSLGKPFTEIEQNSCYSRRRLMNLNISECYNCKEISIWVHDQLIWPSSKIEVKPNQDLPSHIKRLFDEAREIVLSSPKGAAALLRLSIQHLCKELGESGKNIDDDIASLVAKGLNPLVQKALDIVRVIGNEAVHPGEINLDDDSDTALQLFGLINLIADQMITQPKQVEALYKKLPEKKLNGIEQRNKKALENS
ncbi:DUF4145 domain-containing protein [Chitinibacter bivalviorum]|uniref:DUF4145 domain-containing protein n=1 Tax=Chitinibacter bivalviorum TaxID=2739434 RepID=A0A7H9BHG6_9NEIS|nr:DUF4145 domain-containing protein [Chitinibacter bivalviorum]QLG88170.1 DUF4145 domain-containing protein [Chitinibacter bivalviorum]